MTQQALVHFVGGIGVNNGKDLRCLLLSQASSLNSHPLLELAFLLPKQ